MSNRELRPRIFSALATIVSGTILTLALSSSAQAKSSYYYAFQSAYPGSSTGTNVVSGMGSSCVLCHGPATTNDFNGYGWKLRNLMNGGMNIGQAITAAETFDSDGDPGGFSNLDEINSDTQPGWTVGANNTIYHENGGTTTNQSPPAGILGEMDPSAEPGSGYCFGDPGSGTPCPCSNDNDGSVPGSGCDNGVFASGAKLVGSGVASLSSDTLVLSCTGLEPNNSGLYFQANNDLSPGNIWGDGLQCAGGQLKRLGVRFADGSGASTTSAWATPISVKAGNIVAGDTKRYQCWYRTTSNPPCGPGVNDFNSSNGYAVTWAP